MKKIINESVVTSLSQKTPMSLGGMGWEGGGSILHAQPVQNHERNSSQTSDQFHGGFSPKTTYVWGMLSEAVGSSSAGLSLLISLSFIRQREIQNRRSEEVEEEEKKRIPNFLQPYFVILNYFVVQD